ADTAEETLEYGRSSARALHHVGTQSRQRVAPCPLPRPRISGRALRRILFFALSLHCSALRLHLAQYPRRAATSVNDLAPAGARGCAIERPGSPLCGFTLRREDALRRYDLRNLRWPVIGWESRARRHRRLQCKKARLGMPPTRDGAQKSRVSR